MRGGSSHGIAKRIGDVLAVAVQSQQGIFQPAVIQQEVVFDDEFVFTANAHQQVVAHPARLYVLRREAGTIGELIVNIVHRGNAQGLRRIQRITGKRLTIQMNQRQGNRHSKLLFV